MSTFKVGDRVVCIKEHPTMPELIVGREYIVYGINKCCVEAIDVGIFANSNCLCSACKQPMSDEKVFFFNVNRFRKVEEQRNVEVQYVKVSVPVEEPCLN
jgi:hypothetical protein